MKSLEIRKRFFDYFVKNGHEKVASSSLIPAQDPTLLFANAGMNQFKDLFLGNETRNYTRAVSIQKCVRAGGKHNDLDNVGFTKRHLTFFEMMGNFSFGDYFKKEAIHYAWEFLTKEIKLSVDQLYVTVFKTDDESFDIWHNVIGVPKEKIFRLGEDSNFWQMGDIGPCGPCTEIFIDRGSDFGCGSKDCSPACGCDRFLEIWNLVFMQFEKQPNGDLKPLKQTGVDTGMGLERLCSIVQDKDSVFETDLFAGIIKRAEELTGKKYTQSDTIKVAFNVLADHIRAATFLIADGCAPSNDGRGYVLRKIIRRAALFTQKLTEKNIFPELSQVVVQEMGDIYPELNNNAQLIFKVLDSEISKFATNLERGQVILQNYLEEGKKHKNISGEQAFKLYDTYGFPIELVVAAAREHGYTVGMKEFEKLMQQQQEQSGKKMTDVLSQLDFGQEITSEFTGYKELETDSEVIALVHNDQPVTSVAKGQVCYVITRKSPFFIVGGGQVPDHGWLIIKDHKAPLESVRFINTAIGAQITAPIDIKVGDKVTSIVDETWRTNAMKNHTATHLLQAALIQLFGTHIKQAGSLVHPDYLRFDFSYHENLTAEDIKKVEELVNEKIRADIPVDVIYTTLKDALNKGALAFFGDKYKPENVRMIKVEDFSVELCGGTHVPRTGVIGTFKITDVISLSAGHRRIIAVTGPRATELFHDTFDTIKQLSQEFKVKREEVLHTVLKFKEQTKELQTHIKQLRTQLWQTQIPVWLQHIETINGLPFLFLDLQNFAGDELRDIAHALNKQHPGFYFVISQLDGRSFFFAELAEKFFDTINLQKFGSWLQDEHGLRGGGKKNSLQGGGGKFDAKLKESMTEWLIKQK
ncbi:MAG TPA: alanine--tRNA ligase [Candidatus Dependentiae bacterium]|nr:alanine--tRNA ligase [Candidatus Dependentiae bacterium]HRQ63086.1 alanine--tRNA ligase [Candidatus Dependentiae bacterium]